MLHLKAVEWIGHIKTPKDTSLMVLPNKALWSLIIQKTSLKQVWVQDTGKYIFSDNKCYADHTWSPPNQTSLLIMFVLCKWKPVSWNQLFSAKTFIQILVTFQSLLITKFILFFFYWIVSLSLVSEFRLHP